MTSKTIYATDDVSVIYHSEDKIIHHTFHKSPSNTVTRQTFLAGLEAMEKYQVTKWLSDDRVNREPDPGEQEWIASHWTPKAIELGWKYWALVVPDAIEARAYMRPIIEDFYDKGVRIMVFTEPDEALEWLKSV